MDRSKSPDSLTLGGINLDPEWVCAGIELGAVAMVVIHNLGRNEYSPRYYMANERVPVRREVLGSLDLVFRVLDLTDPIIRFAADVMIEKKKGLRKPATGN